MSDVTQTIFYGGEISETVASRVDIPKRQQALKTMRNVFPHKHGAASNRGGTEMLVPASVFSSNVRRIPFVYNNDDTYTIEITEKKLRFIRNGGFILEGLYNIVHGVSSFDHIVVNYGTNVIATWAGGGIDSEVPHGLVVGDYVYFVDNTGAGHYKFVRSVESTSTFKLKNHDGTDYDLIDNGGTETELVDRIYTVASEYLDADIPLLKYQQKADTMKITHRNYFPQDLTRSGHAAWTIKRPDFEPQLERPTNLVASAVSDNDSFFYQFNQKFDRQVIVKSISAATPPIIVFEITDLVGDSIDKNDDHDLFENRMVCFSGGTFDDVGYSEAATAKSRVSGRRIRLKNIDPDAGDTGECLISAEGHSVDGGPIDLDGLRFTYITNTIRFGDKKLRYKVSGVDKDGRESFASTTSVVVASDPMSEERPCNLTWTAPSSYTVEEYYVYKEENEVFGFIGTAVQSEDTGEGLYFNDMNFAPELADNPQEDPMRVPFYTNIEPAGISHTDPISINAVLHRRKVGHRVIIESDSGGFTNGTYYVKEVTDDDNYIIEDADGNTLDGTLNSVAMTGATNAIPCVVSVAAHNFVEGDNVKIKDQFQMPAINSYVGSTVQREFIVGPVTATTITLLGSDTLTPPEGVRVWTDGGTIYGYHSDGFEADYPSSVVFYRQRVGYGSMFNARQTVEYSATGKDNVFSRASDAFSNPMDEAQANELRYMLSGADLLNFTSGSVILSGSGESGFSVATVSNVEQMSAGIDDRVEPLKMRNSLIYVQDKYSQVFDLAYTFEQDKYLGQDLTILSPHLIEETRIISWAYQRIPEPIVWCVLDTGDMIGLLYERDNEIFGWHIHDTLGNFKDVCVQPEGSEERLHLVVERSVDGETVLYHERLWGRRFTKLQDCKFLDASRSLDSPVDITAIAEEASSNAIKITASGHGLAENDIFEVDDTLGSTELNENQYRAANVSGAAFHVVELDISDSWDLTNLVDGDTHWAAVNNPAAELTDEISCVLFSDTGVAQLDDKWFLCNVTSSGTFHVWDFTGSPLVPSGAWVAGGMMKFGKLVNKADISAYTSEGVVRLAVSTVYGLSHLEGETVTALCDGAVVRDNAGADLVVENGSLSFDAPHSRIHVGLEYTPKIETLDLDNPQSQLSGLIRGVERVNLKLHKTRGLKVGPSTSLLQEMKNLTEGTLGENPVMFSGEMSINLQPMESNRGSVVLQQDEPLPFTVQAIGLDVSMGDPK